MGIFLSFKSGVKGWSSWALVIFFIGVTGIGLGSAYYHYNPSNSTLVWDRIPMTVAFMSFFSIVVGRYVNNRAGALLLFPLVILGVASVFTWYAGELQGHGDLRLYAIVQFYPTIAIPLIIVMYPTPSSTKIKIAAIIIFYGIAKICEAQDDVIFSAGEILSGHSWKHLFAAISIALITMIMNSPVADEHDKASPGIKYPGQP